MNLIIESQSIHLYYFSSCKQFNVYIIIRYSTIKYNANFQKKKKKRESKLSIIFSTLFLLIIDMQNYISPSNLNSKTE